MQAAEPPILIADDDRLVLATLEQGLVRAGFNVTAVESGEAALAAAAEKDFALAVLDIRMGGLSGIETAQLLRERYNVPVLFLSAYDESELIEKAAKGGGLSYLVKPIDPAQLVPAVRLAIARARDVDALLNSTSHLEHAVEAARYTSTAVGILMERRRISQQAAFEDLRARARAERRKLEDVAKEVVEAARKLNET